jgi:acetyl-CoA carboxylase biotin carboxyl carrier protein
MDIRKIKKIIEMLQESDLREIEVKEGEESVRIARGGSIEHYQVQAPVQASTQANPSPAAEAAEEMPQSISGNNINSPIVGTFYRKPAPNKPAFVEIGDKVKAGDVVCIVEAMKMMNEIKSDFSGTVKSIEVDDAAPVEFGQVLIVID